jgi:hypothetical protein
MSLISDYDKAYKAWQKLEPRPLQLKFKCKDGDYTVFQIDFDGVGIRDFYQFKGGKTEVEAVSLSKRGRMTVNNWKSKGINKDYLLKFTKWIEDIVLNLKQVKYSVDYKIWWQERPKDLKVRFVNKAGHRHELEYFAGGTFIGSDLDEWQQNLYLRVKHLKAFLNGKEDADAKTAIDTEEAFQKVKRWFERISQ